MLSLSAPGFLRPGDPAPWFVAETSANPRFHADTLGGRYVLLGFLGSAASEPAVCALAALKERQHLFDDVTAAVFTVSSDPQDRERLTASNPGLRAFWDHDLAVARRYGAAVIRKRYERTLLPEVSSVAEIGRGFTRDGGHDGRRRHASSQT